MAQRNVITQTALSDLKLVLNDIAANLSQHINDSMSKAHGINVLPGAVYANSNGDIIGNYVVTFYVGNTIYYAPANLTALTGQPFTNGAIQVSLTNPSAAGSSAWVTDFTSAALAAAEATRDQILIPHTQSGHWEVHGGMSVQSKNTYDAQGHLVGRYVIRFQFNNQVYEIPCDTSLTGAPQPLQVSLSSTYLFHQIQGTNSFKAQHPNGYPLLATASGGAPPYTFQWYYRQDVDPDPSGVALPATCPPGGYEDDSYGAKVTYGLSNVSSYSTLFLLNLSGIVGPLENLYFYVTVADSAANTINSQIFQLQCHT